MEIKNFLYKKNNGLTLIELIIAVSILALALSLTSGVLVSVVKSANKQNAIREVDSNGQLVTKLIEESVRKSRDISYNSTSQQLMVTMDDNTVRYFGVTNGTATSCAGNASYIYMTENNNSAAETQRQENRVTNDSKSSGVYINNFDINFYNGTPKQIFVTISLGSCVDNMPVKVFQTFVTSRGSYF